MREIEDKEAKAIRRAELDKINISNRERKEIETVNRIIDNIESHY